MILFSNGMQIAPLIKGTRNQLSNDRNKVLSSELFNLLLEKKKIYIYIFLYMQNLQHVQLPVLRNPRLQKQVCSNENRSSNDTWHFSFRFIYHPTVASVEILLLMKLSRLPSSVYNRDDCLQNYYLRTGERVFVISRVEKNSILSPRKTFLRYLFHDETFKRSAEIINGIGAFANEISTGTRKIRIFLLLSTEIGGKWRKGDRKGEEARIRIAQRPVCNRRRSSKNNECL